MAFEMNYLVFGLCIFGIFVPIVVECRMREIFGARCEARCLAKALHPRQACTGSCYAACIKPCTDHENFYKVKSCTKYCRDVDLKNNNWQCKSSCKYLLKLYNAGVKSGTCQTINNTQSCGSTSCGLDNECPYLEKCCQQSASCGKTCQKPSFNQTGYPSTPTDVNSTLIKKPRSVVVKWSYIPHNPKAVFIVEVRHISIGSQQGVLPGEWIYINMTREHQLTVSPKSNAWSEYRVLAVKEKGTSQYSTPSSAIYIPPEKPTTPRNFRVNMMAALKGKVRVELVWSKPERSEIPIHRYRVFWSKRLDSHTEELMSLRVHHKKIDPDKHSVLINGLRHNTTYLFEIQAICRYKGQRLRSNRVYLTIRTMEREPANKEVLRKKMDKVFRNSFKKPANKEKMKPKLSGQTLPPPTVSSIGVRKLEDASRKPTTGTSSGINVHTCLPHILCLLLFYVLHW